MRNNNGLQSGENKRVVGALFLQSVGAKNGRKALWSDNRQEAAMTIGGEGGLKSKDIEIG